MFSVNSKTINMTTIKAYCDYVGLRVEKHAQWITVYDADVNMYHDNDVLNVYAFIRGWEWCAKQHGPLGGTVIEP